MANLALGLASLAVPDVLEEGREGFPEIRKRLRMCIAMHTSQPGIPFVLDGIPLLLERHSVWLFTCTILPLPVVM